MVCPIQKVGFHMSGSSDTLSIWGNWTLYSMEIFLGRQWALRNHGFIKVVQAVSILMLGESVYTIWYLFVKSCASVIIWKCIFGLTSFLLFRGDCLDLNIFVCKLNLIPGRFTIIVQNINLCILFQLALLLAWNYGILFWMRNLRWLFHYVWFWNWAGSFCLVCIIFLVLLNIFDFCLHTSFCWVGIPWKWWHLLEHLKSSHAFTRSWIFQTCFFLDHIIFTSCCCLNINNSHCFVIFYWRCLHWKSIVNSDAKVVFKLATIYIFVQNGTFLIMFYQNLIIWWQASWKLIQSWARHIFLIITISFLVAFI